MRHLSPGIIFGPGTINFFILFITGIYYFLVRTLQPQMLQSPEPCRFLICKNKTGTGKENWVGRAKVKKKLYLIQNILVYLISQNLPDPLTVFKNTYYKLVLSSHPGIWIQRKRGCGSRSETLLCTAVWRIHIILIQIRIQSLKKFVMDPDPDQTLIRIWIQAKKDSAPGKSE